MHKFRELHPISTLEISTTHDDFKN